VIKPQEANVGLSALVEITQTSTVLRVVQGQNSCSGGDLVLEQNMFHQNPVFSCYIHL